MLGVGRRAAGPPLSLPSTLEDTTAGWKGGPTGGPDNQSVGGGGGSGPGNGPGGGGGNGGFTPSGPGSFGNSVPVFQQAGQGSPASGNQSVGYQGGPTPGSNTPQYTASPAPSGSSTPGPGPPQNVSGAGFPPPPNSAGPPYNGPGPGPGGPFGSPSAGNAPFGRPGSSGPAFPGGPHFASPGGPGGFGGPQFGMPPGSPFGHGPGGHPMGPMGPAHMMGGPQPVDRMDQGESNWTTRPRRHTSYFSQTEHRVFELNKRLQQRTEESDNCWWDSFATEFFEDDATLTLSFCLEDGPKRYTIGRTLIPRYFRSIYEGGVIELYFHLKHTKESFHNTSITLDCEQCTMVTHHGKPMFTKVCTEGRLILEFMYDDYMRIKSWHMSVRTHRELIPRNVVGMHSSQPDPTILEQISKNITRQGITNSTLNYLRLCVILEPMQELMSRHKAYALSPRDCLKTTLFQKWQRMVAPPGKRDAQRPANKRRKRKGSNSGGPANNAPPVPSKKRSPGPNFSLASQVDVMVVGEPSLMGGEFGDEDERLITRLENTQYDATNSLDHENHAGFGHADSPLTGPNSWNVDRSGGPGGPGGPGGGGGGPQGNTPSNQDTDKKSPAVSQ
ncbi:unnamed protein product [Hermetia illucens]|uniref:LIM interaction domain-containing protein n=1 Tax=Hermetia illucens TaxID=343691 RepID=A0A7R8UW96_HERIL|nr:LIM domain-binding protein 2 isoform X1 [Hermetia illucens]CAD7088290.1 unnamed protein product [Hermetia illucens]